MRGGGEYARSPRTPHGRRSGLGVGRVRTPPPPATGRGVGTWRPAGRRLGPWEQARTQKDFLALVRSAWNSPQLPTFRNPRPHALLRAQVHGSVCSTPVPAAFAGCPGAE